MPAPDVGNVDFVIARLVLESSFAERNEAREEKKDANAEMIAAQKDQIAQLREQADERYFASQLDAFGRLAEGGCGVVGGLASAGAFGGALGDENVRVHWGDAISSGGKATGGALGLVGAGYAHRADLDGAHAKADEMDATVQKDEYDDASDRVKEARDQARTALDFVRQYEDTKSKSQASAIKA